jgi:hypothetical protein
MGVSVQIVTKLGGSADFSRLHISSRVSDLMRFRSESEKGTATLHHCATEAIFFSRVVTGDES